MMMVKVGVEAMPALDTGRQTVARMNGCKSPFFVLEKLVNDDFWNSSATPSGVLQL